MSKKFASVSWSVDDLLSLRPDWSESQAEEWLFENQKYLQDAMVQAGWAAMEDLLPK